MLPDYSIGGPVLLVLDWGPCARGAGGDSANSGKRRSVAAVFVPFQHRKLLEGLG